jgi:tellurite resistance protein TerC
VPLAPVVAASSADSRYAELDVPPWGWALFLALVAALLLVDLLVVHREAHVPSFRRAAVESTVWISIGVAFSGVIWAMGGSQAAGEYITGYLIEKSLSVDNVFVWAVILSYFKVPRAYQHRVLFWGVFGALALRAVFIFAGIALLDRLEWVIYLFGAFLVLTALRLAFGNDDEFEPSESRALRAFRRAVPSTDDYDGQRLFTRRDGVRLATPLFFVLVVIEVTDLLFAVDSVPAVLAVARDQFIVFSSNAFAILGLRALYFLLADLHGRFRYLERGLSVVLAFVGLRMVLGEGILGVRWNPPTWLPLAVIAAVLAVSIGLSIAADRRDTRAGVSREAGDGRR